MNKLNTDGIKCTIIGGVGAIVALIAGADAAEALLTFIAAGGAAIAVMPFKMK